MLYNSEGRPEIDGGTLGWFRRWVTQRLEQWVTHEQTEARIRARLEDPDIRAHIVDAYCERAEEFVGWRESDRYEPDIERDFGQFYANKDLIAGALWSILQEAEEAVARMREALAHPTLDAWLTAALTGKISRSIGFAEPNLADVLDSETADRLSTAAKERARHWPRACRDCGEQFRPMMMEVRCPDCLRRYRGGRPAFWEAGRECSECGATFRPDWPNRWRCPSCRKGGA